MTPDATARPDSESDRAAARLRGQTHLQAFEHLSASMVGPSIVSQSGVAPQQLLGHLDAAIEAFAGDPAARTGVHLVKAGFLAHLARCDPAHRLAWVTGAMDACHLSMESLQESDDLRYATVSDWHARATAVLLALRDLVDEPEPRAALEDIIVGHSQILGIALSEELGEYEEGRARLAMAEILDALIEAEENPSARRWMWNDRQELAESAFDHLARTSHLDLAHQAWLLAHIVETEPYTVACPVCGRDNLPDSSFCTACGSPLAAHQAPAPAAVRCPACGAPDQAGHRFCTKCGVRL